MREMRTQLDVAAQRADLLHVEADGARRVVLVLHGEPASVRKRTRVWQSQRIGTDNCGGVGVFCVR